MEDAGKTPHEPVAVAAYWTSFIHPWKVIMMVGLLDHHTTLTIQMLWSLATTNCEGLQLLITQQKLPVVKVRFMQINCIYLIISKWREGGGLGVISI